jgi:hypothetical protein
MLAQSTPGNGHASNTTCPWRQGSLQLVVELGDQSLTAHKEPKLTTTPLPGEQLPSAIQQCIACQEHSLTEGTTASRNPAQPVEFAV